MADLEIIVRYKSVPARVVLGLIVLSLPVWGIIVPGILVLGFFMVLSNFDSFLRGLDHWDIVLKVVLGLLAMPCFGVLSTLAFADNRIIASKAGVSFPIFLLPLFSFRRQFPWSEVKRLQLLEIGNPEQENKNLVFHLSGHKSIRLLLSGLPADGVEQLLLSAELWGGDCQKDVAVLELHRSLQDKASLSDHLSYTAMWEEELSRRFSSTSFMPLEPGHSLQNGHLSVVRQLAFGGLSAIYLVQRNNKELFVLKEAVVPGGADDTVKQKAAELFEREAHLLRKLEHPYIARVLDHFVESGRNYLLLDYVNGQDLRQLVKQHGPQPESSVIKWGVEIARILVYLHGQNPPIIHRDLTPDNLVLRESGTVTLIDFGAANEFVGTATGTLVGKQAYISPEQFRGKAVVQSDIYALGCTLFFLVTGQDPEALSTSKASLVHEQVSQGLDLLIADCTAMEAGERIGSAQEVVLRLEALAPEPAGSVKVSD